MVLAGWTGYTRNFRPVVGLIVLSMALFYAGFAYRWDYWDHYAPIKNFSRQMAATVALGVPDGAGPGRIVYHWGSPESQMPFYFGRNIPSIRWQFDRQEDKWHREGLSEQEAHAKASQLWDQWIRDANNAPWIADTEKLYPKKGKGFVKPQHVDELERLGYRVVLTVREKGWKQQLFTLYRRVAAPSSSAPTTMPEAVKEKMSAE